MSVKQICKEVIGEYFPNCDCVNIRSTGTDYEYSLDVLLGMSENDYLAYVLVYGVGEDKLAHIITRELVKNDINVYDVQVIRMDKIDYSIYPDFISI